MLGKYEFLQKLFSNTTKTKIQNIKQDTKALVAETCSENFWINWYGAYDVDPKYFVFWICIQSDTMKHKLESNKELMLRIRKLLEKYNYPIEARNSVHIGFESQETVDRESGGDWHIHFK